MRIVLIQAARLTSEQKISFQSADLTVAEEAQKVFTSCERVPDVVICCAGITPHNPRFDFSRRSDTWLLCRPVN